MIISFTQRKTELEMDDATSLIQFSRNTPVSVRLSDNTYLSNTDIPHPNYRYALTWQDKNRINVAKTDLEYDEEAELYYGKIGKAATIFSGLTYVSLAAIDVDSGITLTTHSAEVYILRSIDPEAAALAEPATLEDVIDEAVDKWITANGVESGATVEQAEQIANSLQGSGYINLTADTQEEICSSNFDNLPVNRIYPVGTDCTAANMPVSDGGIVATLSRRNGSVSVGTTQLFISRAGRMFTRTYWSGSWGAWTEYAMDADIDLTVHGLKTNITAETAAEVCNSNANNLPNNRIYGIGLTDLSDCANLPAVHGVLVTIGKSNNRTASDTQLFIQRGGAMWSRTYWASTWTPWIRSDNTQLLKILCVGDSLAYGSRNSHKGFVGDLGLPYKIAGQVGATLSNKRADTATTIPDQLTEVTDYTPDIIIAEGGVNDYYYGVMLGEIPTVPVTTDSAAEALNRDTVMGGLQYLLYKMITLYPDAQRFFVLTHKILDWPYTANTAGYTQTELFHAISTVCSLYSTKVIDIFGESCINTAFDVYKSSVAYNTDNSITDTEWVDSDGIHPLAYGYLHGYVPLIRQALQIGTSAKEA